MANVAGIPDPDLPHLHHALVSMGAEINVFG